VTDGRAGKPTFSLEIRAVAIWAYLLFALAAGAMLPIQFGINAQLAAWVGGSVRAAFVSFVVGAVALLFAVLVAARGWPERAGDAPWWVWTGGLLGAFYVLGSIVTAPKLGAATLVAVILAGQAVASLLVDHFGWVGFDEQPITLLRVLGIVLLAGGVALVRLS
jgi:bacterial/archaeal transporter family-2 protein